MSDVWEKLDLRSGNCRLLGSSPGLRAFVPVPEKSHG